VKLMGSGIALNNELTKEGVPAQYDQKIDGVVDSEVKKYT
jgi:hypothetical protein